MFRILQAWEILGNYVVVTYFPVPIFDILLLIIAIQKDCILLAITHWWKGGDGVCSAGGIFPGVISSEIVFLIFIRNLPIFILLSIAQRLETYPLTLPGYFGDFAIFFTLGHRLMYTWKNWWYLWKPHLLGLYYWVSSNDFTS